MFATAEAKAFRKFPEKSVKKGACVHFVRAASESFVLLWVVRSVVIHQGVLRWRTESKRAAPPAVQVSFATAQGDIDK